MNRGAKFRRMKLKQDKLKLQDKLEKDFVKTLKGTTEPIKDVIAKRKLKEQKLLKKQNGNRDNSLVK